VSLTADSRKRLNRAGVYTASAAGHVLFFVALGLSSPEVRRVFVEDPVVPVDVFITPPPPRETTRRSEAEPSPRPTPVRPRQAVVSPLPMPVAPLPMAPTPTARPAPPAAVTGGGSGGAAGPGSLQPRGGLREALRRSPVGCANQAAVGLNIREREACAERFGTGAADTPFIPAPIAGAKRRDWDAAAARKEIARERKRAPVPPGTATTNNAGGTRTDGIGILGY